MKVIIDEQVFDIDLANTFKKKLIGLMGKKSIKNGLLFPKTRSIHTFFMKEPIDIIMINKNNIVIDFRKNFPKWRILIKKKAYHTIELPQNSLHNISIGDKLTIS